MTANPALLTSGTGKGNTVISPQPGMLVQPVVAVDASGNVSSMVPANNGNGAELNVSLGFTNAVTTLNAVTANTTGTAIDAGSAQSNWTAVAVATGSPTAGVISLELSLDGTNWVSSGSTNSITAAGTYPIFSTGRTARYGRVSLYSLSGTISLTVKVMAAG